MAANELASVDGRISATTAAIIPLPDDGLYRGDGVFEVIRLYRGRPFALREHLDRLERSAAAIELRVDLSLIERELVTLLAEFGTDDAQLRIVLTRAGRRILLIEHLPEQGDSVRLATVTYSPTVILTGVKLLVRPDGIVLEAPTSAIFWVSPQGGLRTPSLEAGILDSITRAQIVRSLDVEEGEFPAEDLLGAHEAFLASTVREVQPVAGIDGHELETGPRTLEAHEAFKGALKQALGSPQSTA
ncbi:MAG: hypothetical protein E6G48_08665 [Actinobacteria bacterium]|nr:MAG: hypothetical protein E6G48_08665 [Actinomycetota bacterium]